MIAQLIQIEIIVLKFPEVKMFFLVTKTLFFFIKTSIYRIELIEADSIEKSFTVMVELEP